MKAVSASIATDRTLQQIYIYTKTLVNTINWTKTKIVGMSHI